MRSAWRQRCARQTMIEIQWRWKSAGAWHIPPGGLGLFRQAVPADAPGGCASGHELCVLFLTDNDALLVFVIML